MEQPPSNHHSPPGYGAHPAPRQRSTSHPYSAAGSPRQATSYYDPTSEARVPALPYHAQSPTQRREPTAEYYHQPLPPPPPPPPPMDQHPPFTSPPPPPAPHAHPYAAPNPQSPPYVSDAAKAERIARRESLGLPTSYPVSRSSPPHVSEAAKAERIARREALGLPTSYPVSTSPVPVRRGNPMAMMNLLSDVYVPPPAKLDSARPQTPPSVGAVKAAGRRTSATVPAAQPSIKQEQLELARPPPAQPPVPAAIQPVTPAPRAPPLPARQSGPPQLTVRDTERAFREIEAQDLSDVEADVPGMERARYEWDQRMHKRTLELEKTECSKRKRRRVDIIRKYQERFESAAVAERTAYIDNHENEVSEEVRQREIEEDKERKKDQQRKRRREKAIADEEQKRAEAIQTLATIEDDEERARLEKEIQRYNKKIRDTQHRLQGLPIKREQADRNESPAHAAALGRREREVAMDGGSLMTSFYGTNGADEGTPELPAPTKGRGGARTGRGGAAGRARKSKEQKQAEKEAAARGQAFLDLGQELPTIAPKEEERLQGIAERRQAREDSEPLSDMPAAGFDSQPTAGLTGMARFESKGYNQIYEQISREIAKGIPKVCRIKNSSLDTKQSNARKTAQLAAKEARRWQARTNKSSKDVQARAKRAMREMLGFWKRNERDEREGRKAAERQELDKARRAEAEREANRQKRKLNFLISQTELYSHFIGKKVKTDEFERHGAEGGDGVVPSGQTTVDKPDAHAIDMPDSVANVGAKVTNFEDLDFDAEDETALQQAAMANAQNAIKEAQDRARAFNNQGGDGDTSTDLAGAQADFDEGEMNFQNPTSLQSMDVAQPKLLSCQLKEYQLKGLNWLVNLYEQGINGILADEMGLGKTVQSISVMAYLAEVHNIWGPFLVIAPASTLHNWQQEITRFVPDIKVLPYWGSAKDRKILRKFWDRKHITYTRDSPFHVLVTSYQLVVQDTAYFQKIKWQYMILDEAQAIKSSQSSRWKSLLGFHCRNRLLLTGTPIQNNMQELWALLHFIMPSLFDSHDEFSEWFSKDIENHAQSNTKLNEDQLRRLHMILKPFMLRRIKKHVQKELGDKIEEDVFCDLTYRQRAYYTSLRNKISILDLIEKAAVGDDQDTATLMNLVMQFRKVCNHPDLFERAAVRSPMSMSYFAETASFMREGSFVQVAYSVRSLIEYWLPRMLGEGAGQLSVAGPDNSSAGWRRKVLETDLSIWDERNITESVRQNGAFSWLRFVDHSATGVAEAARRSLIEQAVARSQDQERPGRLRVAYDEDGKGDQSGYTPNHAMFEIVKHNDPQPLAECTELGHLDKLFNISRGSMAEQGYGVIESCYFPSASAPPVDLVCRSQRVLDQTDAALFNVPIRRALFPISANTESALLRSKLAPSNYPPTNLLPAASKHKQRFTQISVPSMRRFVTDSGKLARLDQLLRQLKEGGHRVLLYFQMTRMIDLMEEYLTYRNYKYCRLDGSTKLEDRRDTVAAFQSSPEIFVFLLSTRAGGLGINLTSADTVIFYDSDWNPTIDSQAMDRAHRLGQTRQVTVYRLITRGTIEERIRKRALQKEEVQRVVISGHAGTTAGAAVDFNARSARDGNRTKEMAMWLADDDQAAAIERREAEVLEEEARAAAALGASGGAGATKRKRKTAAPSAAAARRKEVSMDDMYHEGEGRFEDASNSHDPSGAATPVSLADGGLPAGKKRKGLSKKAKTVKQRLAVIDGEVG